MNEKRQVPFFGINRLFENHKEEILNTVASVFSHGRVLQGPEVLDFEKNIADYCGRKYAVAVGSCTDALFFALKSAGIEQGDEVLVTCFSFIASATPIVRIGAIPVFVDIEPDNYMMDIVDLESKISDKTKAIVVVHLFGQMLPLKEVEDVARKYNLIVIEDAAQSLGSKQGERMAGTLGISSSISFDPTKIVGSFGSGGVLLTDDDGVESLVRKLRYHGKDTKAGIFDVLGYNSQLSTAQAALLSLQLNWLEDLIKRREEIARVYFNEISDIDGLIMPAAGPENRHIYHKFVLATDERNGLRTYLQNCGVKTMIHYDKTINERKSFKKFTHKADGLVKVQDVKKRVLSLPIFPEMENEEIDYVCKAIIEYFKTLS